jgi:hypothetical protein
MTKNTSLVGQLDDYLAILRAFGYRLARPEKLLRQFLAYIGGGSEPAPAVAGSDHETLVGLLAGGAPAASGGLVTLRYHGPFLSWMSWRTPDNYQLACIRRGTASSNFCSQRDNLRRPA